MKTGHKIRYEDLPDKHKEIADEFFRAITEEAQEHNTMRIIQNAKITEKKYVKIHKQWKDGELPGKALINELQPEIELLKKDAEIINSFFEGKQIDKSLFKYPSMVQTGSEIINEIINRLEAFMDELKQEYMPGQGTETQVRESEEQRLENERQVVICLFNMQKLKKKPEIRQIINDKEIVMPAEYWIKTTYNDVKETLIKLKAEGKIKIHDVDLFMVTYLKGKNGGDISCSIRTARSVKNCEKT
jgi:hypothetical protein